MRFSKKKTAFAALLAASAIALAGCGGGGDVVHAGRAHPGERGDIVQQCDQSSGHGDLVSLARRVWR